MVTIDSVNEAIDTLGGTVATAALSGVRKAAVSSWRRRQLIPPEYFLLVSSALAGKGKQVAPSIFGMKPAVSAAMQPRRRLRDRR